VTIMRRAVERIKLVEPTRPPAKHTGVPALASRGQVPLKHRRHLVGTEWVRTYAWAYPSLEPVEDAVRFPGFPRAHGIPVSYTRRVE